MSAEHIKFDRDELVFSAKWDELRGRTVRMDDGKGNIVRKLIRMRGGPYDGRSTTVSVRAVEILADSDTYQPSGEKADWHEIWDYVSGDQG